MDSSMPKRLIEGGTRLPTSKRIRTCSLPVPSVVGLVPKEGNSTPSCINIQPSVSDSDSEIAQDEANTESSIIEAPLLSVPSAPSSGLLAIENNLSSRSISTQPPISTSSVFNSGDRQGEVVTVSSIAEVPVMQCGLITTDANVDSVAIGATTPLNVPALSHFQQIILHKFPELTSVLHTDSLGNDVTVAMGTSLNYKFYLYVSKLEWSQMIRSFPSFVMGCCAQRDTFFALVLVITTTLTTIFQLSVFTAVE